MTGRPRRDDRRCERGHVLAGLMVAVAILLILSTVAFQAWGDVLQREKEAEMMFRAQEIARGILRFRREQQGEPLLTLDRLLEPGNDGQYFLRRAYPDPLSEDGKWGLLYDANGSIIDPSAQNLPGQGGGQGGSPFNNSVGNSGSLSNQQNQQQNPGQNQGQPGQQGQPGRPGQPGAPNFGQLPATGGFTPKDGLSGGLGNRNPTGGGAPIAGVKTTSTEQPFRIWNDLEEYSEWLFSYRAIELDLQRIALAGKVPQAQNPGNRQLNPGVGGRGRQGGRPGGRQGGRRGGAGGRQPGGAQGGRSR